LEEKKPEKDPESDNEQFSLYVKLIGMKIEAGGKNGEIDMNILRQNLTYVLL
jgi:hypothetical protein